MIHDDETTIVSAIESLSTGEEWPFHYRGYGLSVNPSGDVWWQAYNGTDRLALEPTPSALVDELLNLKTEGGRFRVTESGAVITKIETSSGSDEYDTVYVGQLDFDGELVPSEEPEHAIEISPGNLDPGDLWTTVFDGSRYSFSGERFWWHDGGTKLRHPFAEELPGEIVNQLRQLRTDGGRFVITPQGDVVTQIPTTKTPPDVRSQFRELPRPVKRYLQLRRDRGNVNMVPVYVGHLSVSRRPIVVEEPTRLTDPLSETEEASLEAWVASMGTYEERDLSEGHHRFDRGGGEGR